MDTNINNSKETISSNTLVKENISPKTSGNGNVSAKNAGTVEAIADIKNNFTQWYTDVVLKTGLVDYGPVKGTMVIRPYGYAIWEAIQRELNTRFAATGHSNCYFPLLIPKSFMQKEAEHVEGFAPECVTVTKVGQTELAEELVVRPTSETIICDMYSKWVQSYRDLPLLYNQWANIMRWEKNTRPFLRTSEFLWQEGHTVHATESEAQDETIKMLKVYEEFCKNVLAIPVLTGKKSEKEKFAGAVATYSIEAMMQDGKALQAGTSHYLGQNFAKAFDIKFLDKDNVQKYAYQTSWGVTTRLIGAVIMTHGDERGLCLPPRVAPIQVMIVPVLQKKDGVIAACESLEKELKAAQFRVKLDTTDNSPGWKFAECEMKGIPLRIECGPRDIEAGNIVITRRDTLEKIIVARENAVEQVKHLLDEIHENMYKKAKDFLYSHVIDCQTLEQIGDAVETGNFAQSMWCGDKSCELVLKEKFAASSRNMPFDQTAIGDICPICGRKAEHKILWGRAY